MGLTDYAENKVLDSILGSNHASAFPATVYVALYTTVPTTDAGSGAVEVTGGSYARVSVTNNSTNWPNATGGLKSNATAIAFPTATASWGTVTGYGIYDAATSGNLILFGTLSSTLTVGTGSTPTFAIGAFTIAAD